MFLYDISPLIKMRHRIKKHVIEHKHHYKVGLLGVILFAIFFFAHSVGEGISEGEELALTPLEDIFSLQIGDIPQIDVEDWSLEINGLVDNPVTFTYDDILALERGVELEVLMCVQSPRRLRAVGDWKGVRLNDLLSKAGVKPGSKEVVFYAVDGFSSSLELEDISEDVILAYEVNGETLSASAGYPLRLVVPNKWGYKWVKWVNKIELVDYDYKGFWESRGWDDKAEVPEKYRL